MQGRFEITRSIGCGEDRACISYTRQTVVHDLWHVVTGYGRDHLGEIALVQIMRIQTRDTGLFLSTWLPFLFPSFGSRERRFIWDARRRARAAVWLPAQDWETLLHKPLDMVREILKLGSPPVYEPTA